MQDWGLFYFGMLYSISMVGIVVIGSFVSSFFVTRMGIQPDMWGISLFFMFLFALPSFISIFKADYKKAMITILVLSIFSLVIESFAIHTGFPYGTFYYEDVLGPKILGLAPLAVPLGWIPLVIAAFALVRRLGIRFPVVCTALILVMIDLVIDPGAFALGIWIWKHPGIFYGVPLQNFLGWFFSGMIGAWAVKSFFGDTILKANYRIIMLSLIGVLSYWSGIAYFEKLWIPMVIGILMLGFLFHTLTARNQQ